MTDVRGHAADPADREAGDGTAQFVLRWTPTVDDYERIAAARRRATGAVWLDRAMGVVYLVLGLVLLLGTRWSPGAVPWLLLGAGMLVLAFGFLTGRAGRWYRRAFTWRSNPGLFLPVEDTVDARGIRSVAEGQVQESSWSHWRSVLELPEYLVVATSRRGNASVNILSRGGLQDPDRWDELVRFVRARVGSN